MKRYQTNKRKEVERKFKTPLPDLIREWYPRLGSTKALGEIFGVHANTVLYWMRIFNIPRMVRSLPPEWTSSGPACFPTATPESPSTKPSVETDATVPLANQFTS